MQQVKEYLNDYNNKPVTRFTKFLWWCAGADRQLLLQSPMSDRVKYAGIGGIVFCTGLLAAFSGGYAFYTIFSPKGDAVNEEPMHLASATASIFFGIIWGLIILNMDRFIVSSTGKGDGTDKITGKELLQALPRIIIAVILGFAISAPLEVRILKTEIDAELQKKQDVYLFELNKNTDIKIAFQMKSNKEELAKAEKEIDEIDLGFEKQRLEIREQRRLLELEAEGKTGSGTPGRGPAYRDKKENLDKMEAELNEKRKNKQAEVSVLKNRINNLTKEKDQIEADRKRQYQKNQLIAHQLDGLMERIHISHEIGGVVPWIIFLVLLSIEAGPIFFKLMMNKGVYDYLVENNNKRIEAYNGIIVSKSLVHGKDDTLHAEKVDMLEVEQEIETKKQKIAKASDLTSKVIDHWHEQKKDEIQNNPKDFYDED
jgi:hypothetical protein